MTGGRSARSGRLGAVLQSARTVVSLPLWVCVVLLVILVLINVQVKDLRDRLSPDSPLQLHHTRSRSYPDSLNVAEDELDMDFNGDAVLRGDTGLRGDSVLRGDTALRGDTVLRDDAALQNSLARKEKDNPWTGGEAEGMEDSDLDQRPGEAKQREEDEAARRAHAPKPEAAAANAPEPADHDAAVEALSDGEVAALAQVLEMRIARASSGIIGLRNCSTLAAMNNVRGTCVDRTCPRDFHPSAETRIRQLLIPGLRLTARQRDSIRDIARDVQQKKYIFVTAASSNHYNESQALVNNMRTFVFPKLRPDSYSFYYFDLGLKPLERRRVVKNCNCTVRDLNLKAFPSHVTKLMCYAWKPLIITALLSKAEVLVYMDVSIRFQDMDMEVFFDTARQWGAQFLHGGDSIPNHTVMSMFDYYRDLPCMYWRFPELMPGFSVLHNEPFIHRVVLEPWVSCALNVSCMCPVDPHAYRICPHKERRVGQCHRFDLSSLTLQMAKLYGDKFGHLVLQANHPPRISRDDRMAFFTD